MKILFLAAESSIHTIKWVNSLAKRNEIHLITMHKGVLNFTSTDVKTYYLKVKPPFGYYLNCFYLRNLIKLIKPDLLHVHYASGYGTLGRLVNFHPMILSVWGSDVYDFPEKSRLNRWLVQKNLLAADWVCSTSNVMAKRTIQLCPSISEISVVPFGVDTNIFRPIEGLRNNEQITIGTVKTLAPKYGIDLLIYSFRKIVDYFKIYNPDLVNKLRLLIVGDGPQKMELIRLSNDLELRNLTEFVDSVPHDQVPNYLNRLDIYVAASRLESFGVAVVEASSCGLPVVVANVGGLPEVVKHSKTGFVVEKENIESLASAIITLVKNEELRKKLGEQGRSHVLQHYKWNQNVSQMEQVYIDCLRKYSNKK
jgi:glycosyltransferase involved in cell wall biosynthesis